MKIFSKQKFMKDGKLIKKYKFCGITMLRKEKSPTKKKWNLLGVKVCKKRHFIFNNISKPENFDKTQSYNSIKANIISIDTIKKIIASDSIKVVSFDIFDTLLVRPAINPTDIWYLMDAKLQKLYGLNFLKYRQNAEQELNNPFANINDIYNYIRDKYNLSSADIKLMKDEELHCEKQLLERREDIYELYNYAVSLGKKVIACSDMYLPSKFLLDVLKKNGYTDIKKVYVSNECKARKDSGQLYDILTEKEKTKKILHIGDNYNSDYLEAIKHQITAIHYPSIIDIVLSGIYKNVWIQGISPDPMCRIILGYTLNKYFSNLSTLNDYYGIFADYKSFAKLSVAPLIFYIANSIANNAEIQSNYNQILFASRDGYLPKIGYNIMEKYCKILPSKYVYAGRRAYFSYLADDFIEYLSNLNIGNDEFYGIANLLDTYIFDEKLKHKILTNLSASEIELDFSKNRQEVINILSKFRTEINHYIETNKKEIEDYYKNIANNDSQREIVFDCGYSGSISTALSLIMKKSVDKKNLWQTSKNKILDYKNNTKTIVLMHEEKLFSSNHIVYEEIFSPLEGGCIGFNNSKPLFEKIMFSSAMKNDCENCRKYIAEYMKDICLLLREYLPYIKIFDTYALQAMLNYAITKSPYCETQIFKNIVYPDTVFWAESSSLSRKIEKYENYLHPYYHTGFDNPQNKLTVQSFLHPNNMKIGIHCHLYNIYLYEELLGYLKDFPQKFDLIITICDNKYKHILENVFNIKTISNLNKLIILTVPNRGRDVAPWLVGTKNLQKEYDIFCHIHSKVSKHFAFGNGWRKYLFDNLIQKDAIINIVNNFILQPYLGCVFPNVFEELRQFCINQNIEKCGVDGEIKIIDNLVSKMQIEHQFTRNEMYFSEGTMMWYRPKALEKLFALNLQYTDFPEEPIGVGGTIAHAIERLPAFVARAAGYEAKMYNLE